MEKKILTIAFLLVLIILCVFLKNKQLYEYYDLNGEYGISIKCVTNPENLICLKKDSFIQVMQYSEIEE